MKSANVGLREVANNMLNALSKVIFAPESFGLEGNLSAGRGLFIVLPTGASMPSGITR